MWSHFTLSLFISEHIRNCICSADVATTVVIIEQSRFWAKRYLSDKQWKSVTLENVGRGMQNVHCTYTHSGGKPYSLWVRLRTHTHTYTHDWGLWVMKVRMRRSDERKSENVRSIDIEHEPTTEGLACVGGNAKHPHVCAALDFDRSGASLSAPQLTEACCWSEDSFYHTTRDLHRCMENQVATHTYIVKGQNKEYKHSEMTQWLHRPLSHCMSLPQIHMISTINIFCFICHRLLFIKCSVGCIRPSNLIL